MIRLALNGGILLLAGIFMIDVYAEPATIVQTLSITTTRTSSNITHPTTPTHTNTSSVPSNTTSHAPTNTTTHPTTTAPSNTTHIPSNTTSHAPTNTTTHSTTPTTPVLPTVPSAPTNGNYKVKDANNRTCIIADMGLGLELDNSTTVMQATEAKGKYYFNVNPKQTHAKGTCNESRANLHLEFPEGSIHFVFVKESKKYYIDEVSVNFSLNSAEHWGGTAGKLKLLSTDIGYYVKCKRTPTVKLADNLYLTMAKVKLQAFDIQNDVFGKEEACSYDRNITVLAIAITVIIVLVIAIIIYFVWHKKRSSAYQQI